MMWEVIQYIEDLEFYLICKKSNNSIDIHFCGYCELAKINNDVINSYKKFKYYEKLHNYLAVVKYCINTHKKYFNWNNKKVIILK